MGKASEQYLETLGLWGDGDEIDALDDVEKSFGVKLDYTDAGNWFTAGDVYAALLKALPEDAVQRPDTWKGFAEAISDQTGVDPARVAPETRLIDRSGERRLDRIVLLLLALVAATVVFWPF